MGNHLPAGPSPAADVGDKASLRLAGPSRLPTGRRIAILIFPCIIILAALYFCSNLGGLASFSTKGGPANATRSDRGKRLSGPPSSELSSLIFGPNVSPMIPVDPKALRDLSGRLEHMGSPGAPHFIHALHYFGGDAALRDDLSPAVRHKAIDVLLDSEQAARAFNGSLVLFPTRHGVGVALSEPANLGTEQRGAEAHPGQLLSTLAELGIPGSRPIRLKDGAMRSVSDVVDDLKANFSLEGELAWRAIALSSYVDRADWTNKFDEVCRFDDIARELISRPQSARSCEGLHNLIALTILLKTNEFNNIFSNFMRENVRNHLIETIGLAARSQRGDGSWGMDWHKAPPSAAGRSPADATSPDSDDALLITGHILEWFILLPGEMQPERRVYESAAAWLLASLQTPRPDPDWIRRRYCPVVHATRCIRLLCYPDAPG
jgi:hypothetical protein